MNSKMSVAKATKKDRPKSSVMSGRRASRQGARRLSIASNSHRIRGKGKADGTPEKSTTPSQEENSENRPPSRNVIWNEEIEKLQIRDDELQKLHDPHPPEDQRKKALKSITVRKVKPASEAEKHKTKTVTVAKPAPYDAPIQRTDDSGSSGPRYNPDGSVIPHSILGSYDDFHREAVKKGDLFELANPLEHDQESQVPTLKYEKKEKTRSKQMRAKADDNNALRNWQLKMLQRKKQQGYISKLLQKPPEDLTMNQGENFRHIQEQRYLIDRTIPFMDYGKGYRVGSEFWKLQERFGDEFAGVHMSLTQTEKGYPPPIEHVGWSKTVRKEKGCPWDQNYTVPVFYPWHKAKFYEERKKQLQPVIDELDGHEPDFENLEVIGTNDPYGKSEIESDTGLTEREDEERDEYTREESVRDPLEDYPEVNPLPVFGPSLQIAGQPARWTGDSYGFKDQLGIQARISFESYTGERVTSYLEIVNDGTTSIYFDWKQIPKDNPFELVQAHVQRFYFNNSSGVILPGETMKFPFVFKSPNAGVFTDQWKLETRPVVCGGADIIVTLRGVALQEDIYEQHRQLLEKELQEKQANQIAQQILRELIDAIRMPDRPASPLDAYITEEDIFSRHNQGMHYQHELVEELKQLYLQLFTEEERVGKFWDLCVQDLKDMIMALDDDDERKEPFLHRVNDAVAKMSYIHDQPIHRELYSIGYEFLVEAVDTMVGQSMLIRNTLGLPEKDGEEFPEGDMKQTLPIEQQDASKLLTPQTRKPAVRTSSVGEEVPQAPVKPETKGKESDSKKGKTADKAKTEAKDKKTAGKDAKAPKGGKETPKPDAKKAPPGPKKPPSRGPTATPGSVGIDRERTTTPTSPVPSPAPELDPVLEKKYKEKFYCQSYSVLSEMFDRMDTSFAVAMTSDPLDRFRPT